MSELTGRDNGLTERGAAWLWRDIAGGGSAKRIRHAAREKRVGRWKGWA
jgi:hypothetical protein